MAQTVSLSNADPLYGVQPICLSNFSHRRATFGIRLWDGSEFSAADGRPLFSLVLNHAGSSSAYVQAAH